MSEQKRPPLRGDVKFLLCEDVRRENSGKLLIVGLYPGELVVMHHAKPVEGIDAVAAVQSLCFLFIACKGFGRFESYFEIIAPDGRRVAEAKEGVVELGEEKSATVNAMFRPFPVLAFGEHRIRLRLDETEYDYTFDIRRSDQKLSKTLSSPKTKRIPKASVKHRQRTTKAST